MAQLRLDYRRSVRSGVQIALLWMLGIVVFVIPLVLFFFLVMMVDKM